MTTMRPRAEPMNAIVFKVPAIPIAQPRPRARFRGNRIVIYTPEKDQVNAFKSHVRLTAAKHWTDPPMTGPLRVNVDFVFPRTKAQTWKTRPMLRLWHTKKPDIDNCVKAVWDALTGLVWVDDSQICQCTLMKAIASGSEQPHVVVWIAKLEEGEGL